ncbi:MAG: DUF1684 domain-containing protein [Verrucomicrobiota bacterium]
MSWSRAILAGICTLSALVWTAPAATPTPASEAYLRETEAWKAARLKKLLEPDNWLTLVGLHILKPGENTIGSAKGSDVLLAKGPARLGTATVAADGKVTFTLEAGAEALVDGRKATAAELKLAAGEAKPTTVKFGTVSFFVMDRNGKRAIRVKDSESERRTKFAGLDYFPLDPSWRIEAAWEPFDKLRMMPVTDRLGMTGPMLMAGKAVFEREGKRFEFLAIDEGPGKPLFFVFSDATSGKETYAAARFIYTEAKDGKVVLDFNRAENPPCAFTPYAVCPLPPKENKLPFPVRAGEKTYHAKGVE